jgi:EAL domain-containing protein (putative c-di-GMP-specific phosphodiesterase class I)
MHSLDRIVVAEGVETPQQAAFLIARGCDELQGYHFGRPLPAAQARATLSQLQAASEQLLGPQSRSVPEAT